MGRQHLKKAMEVFEMTEQPPKMEMQHKNWGEILPVETNEFYIICLLKETMLANYEPSFKFD